MSTDSYKLYCSCGSDQFSSDGTREADTVMTCVQCSRQGRYGDMLEQAKQQITQKYADVIGNIFKKK